MKNTKKLLALLLSIVMLLSFVGCDIESSNYVESSNVESSNITNTTDNSSDITNSNAGISSTNSKEESSTQEQTPSTTQKPNNSTVETGTAKAVDPSKLPSFSGTAWTVVNDNHPNFSAIELTTKGYEKYSNLDSLDRCGVALASCGKEIMPGANEERGSISSIKPSGWNQAKYSGISGGWLWNRCHLIGWQLSAENANKQNLITGTRYMNIEGMLPFENMVADYIRETGNHVAYRVTPVYIGNNLVCSGVQMEAYSIEDDGEGIEFNVYCYNVQPGIKINYADGSSSSSSSTNNTSSSKPTTSSPSNNVNNNNQGYTKYVLNTNTKKFHYPSCGSASRIAEKNYAESNENRDSLIAKGYSPCGNCDP